MKIILWAFAALVALLSTESHVYAASKDVKNVHISVDTGSISDAWTYMKEHPGQTAIGITAAIILISHIRNANRIDTLEAEIKKMQVMLDRMGITEDIRRSMGK